MRHSITVSFSFLISLFATTLSASDIRARDLGRLGPRELGARHLRGAGAILCRGLGVAAGHRDRVAGFRAV